MLKIYTDKESRSTVVLKMGTGCDEAKQFRINPTATVRARVKSTNGQTAFTGWVVLAYNANTNDDWGLSTLDLIIPAVETSKIVNVTQAKLEVEVSGVYVGKDNVDTADSYTESWTMPISVEVGLV